MLTENTQPYQNYKINTTTSTDELLLQCAVRCLCESNYKELASIMCSLDLKTDEKIVSDEFGEYSIVYTHVFLYVNYSILGILKSNIRIIENAIFSMIPFIPGLEGEEYTLSLKLNVHGVNTNWRNEVLEVIHLQGINNQGNDWGFQSPYACEWNGLKFKSYSEQCILEEFDKRNTFCFPLPAVRVDGKNYEPDFIVQHPETRKFGILEVNGGPYHTPQSSTKDHERSRVFSKRGLNTQFFDAELCRNSTQQVVDEFLEILGKQ